jgi:hypothetical protein
LLGAHFASLEHVTQLFHFLPQLHQWNDAGPLLLVLEENPLAEDVEVLRVFPSLGKRFRAVT